MPLVGCPFCRELQPEGETSSCPTCGVRLEPLHVLPPSYEVRVARAEELSAIPAEDRLLPWWYLRRGRGALILLSVVGLALFFAPWITLHKPDEITLTGFTLARMRGSWFFGGAIGWFVALPLVATRRTVRALRGVRVITALFAFLSVVVTGFLLANPPRGGRYVPVAFEWEGPLYATLLVGLAGTVLATRLGGRSEDIRASELLPVPDGGLLEDDGRDRTVH